LAGENKRVIDWLTQDGSGADFTELKESVKSQYDDLKLNLVQWEEAARQYRTMVHQQITHYSAGVVTAAQRTLAEAREQFEYTRFEWKALIGRCSVAA
jgi:hypothetical protein